MKTVRRISGFPFYVSGVLSRRAQIVEAKEIEMDRKRAAAFARELREVPAKHGRASRAVAG
jgi:hypothetical protein